MSVLAREQKHSRLNDILNELRESHGSTAVRRGIGIRDLFKALHRGELVGMLGDQDAGKKGGVILPFFGRKTTVPTGAFELSRRTGAPILPCYIVRREKGYHEIFVGDPINCGDGAYQKDDLKPYAQAYLHSLEQMISKFPDQWLWGSKRWKYCWTKRIAILSDGRQGHVKQSEALAQHMSSLGTQYGRPGMEYPLKVVNVMYRSPLKLKVFKVLASFLIPWMQGRLALLKLFFTKETYEAIKELNADFFISAGGNMVPLNLCLAKESRGKSIVLMTPSFPFNFFRFDLAVIPEHDAGRVPEENFRTLVAPNMIDQTNLEDSAKKMRGELPNISKIKFGVFLGGDTPVYKMNLTDIEKLLSILERISGLEGDYLMTTSRRTPDSICRFLKSKTVTLKGCQLMVIASEDPRPEVVGGIMALSEVLIVTEESVSMISEALSSGKRVIVLTLNKEALSKKIQRFHEKLLQNSAVIFSNLENLEEKIINKVYEQIRPLKILEDERVALKKRLQEIL